MSCNSHLPPLRANERLRPVRWWWLRRCFACPESVPRPVWFPGRSAVEHSSVCRRQRSSCRQLARCIGGKAGPLPPQVVACLVLLIDARFAQRLAAPICVKRSRAWSPRDMSVQRRNRERFQHLVLHRSPGQQDLQSRRRSGDFGMAMIPARGAWDLNAQRRFWFPAAVDMRTAAGSIAFVHGRSRPLPF